jgi:3-phenylpropionate/trans-cinnamate dioxygenase ferredoxin component
MAWHRIGETPELLSGEKIAAVIDGREILICRANGDYFALSGRCTHAAWPLASEPIEGTEIVCTLHGARFDVRDGCPTLGPASKPLATYPVEQRDGALYVRLS